MGGGAEGAPKPWQGCWQTGLRAALGFLHSVSVHPVACVPFCCCVEHMLWGWGRVIQLLVTSSIAVCSELQGTGEKHQAQSSLSPFVLLLH